MLTRLCSFICCPLLCMTCTILFLHQQLLNLFRLNFPMDNEQYCVMSCEQKPKEATAERKASCVARSELNFPASCQDSCTRLEDLQAQPWGASEERLMHGYRRLTWEMKQEAAQMGTERGDHWQQLPYGQRGQKINPVVFQVQWLVNPIMHQSRRIVLVGWPICSFFTNKTYSTLLLTIFQSTQQANSKFKIPGCWAAIGFEKIYLQTTIFFIFFFR